MSSIIKGYLSGNVMKAKLFVFAAIVLLVISMLTISGCVAPNTNISVNSGNVNSVKQLVNAGNKIDFSDSSLLSVPISTGNVPMVRYLLEQGVNPNKNVQFSNGLYPPIHEAAASGNIWMVKLLVSYGANVNSVYPALHSTPLIQAAMKNHVDVMRFLIDSGADVNLAGSNFNGTALHQAAKNGHLDAVRFLVKNKALIDAYEDKNGTTPLIQAVINGHVDVVNFLLTNNADPDLLDKKHRQTALHTSVVNGNYNMVKVLLENKSTPNVFSSAVGTTPIHQSVIDGRLNILKLLHQFGGDIDLADMKYNITALIEASSRGHYDIASYLVNNGVDIDHQNKHGATALMYASVKRHDNIVRLLLMHGANRDLISKKGQTAYSLAKGSPSTLAILKSNYQNNNSKIKPYVTLNSDNNKDVPKIYDNDSSTDNVSSLDISSNRWAVVIGVSDYLDSRVPALRYASKDAESFYSWLVSPEGGRYAPQRVKLLVDDDATNGNIKQALYKWLGQAIEEDQVTIFFAGHGSPNSPDTPENLFLLPYDVNYESIESSGFPMWDIETALHRFIKAKKVTVIADACHSGGIGKSYDVVSRANRALQVNRINSGLQNLSKVGDGVAVISASGDGEFSREGEEWGGGHGVFTHFLLEGLKGDADYNSDKDVTLGELIPYISEKVRRATRSAQSPTVSGRFDPAMSIGR